MLNSQRTQDYGYDTLNRLTSYALGGTTLQQFSVDPFGNMSLMSNGSSVSTFDPSTNRISNLPCGASATAYDGAGNQTCDTDQNGAVRHYTFDPENRIGQIAISGSNTPFVIYDYLPNGSRVRKSNADGSFTEYIYFDGKAVAEKDQDGNWIDRVYANGQQIAQTHNSDQALHLHGTVTCTTCGTIGAKWFLNAADGYTIQSGDKLAWRQYDGPNAIGSIDMWFYNCCGLGWQYADENGEPVWTLAEHNVWVQRIFDLTPFAGQQLQTFSVSAWPSNSGDWDVWFQDMVLYRADGTVIPFYTRQNPLPTYLYGTFETTGTATTDTVNVAQGANTSLMATTYLTSDHLGTTQMQFAPGGWPLWHGYFSPYGQEMNLQPYMAFPVNIATDNSHKFTGKERDQESGLDYFGARYYASIMGRWMSPDYDADEEDREPAPYADLENPQTLNLYGYVTNNPMRQVDPDGHGVCDVVPCPTMEEVDAGIAYLSTGAATVGEWTVSTIVAPVVAVGGLVLYTPDGGGSIEDRELRQMAERRAAEAAHRKGARRSTKGRHQKGERRQQKDQGGEKGDQNRRPPRKPPIDPSTGKKVKGPWPPRNAFILPLLDDRDDGTVTTSQGPGTPCGGNTGNPCPSK